MNDTYARLKHLQPIIEFSNARGFKDVTRAIITILQEHGCTRVLEVCCGTGKLVQDLERHGMDVTGVDGSSSMLDRARAKNRGKHLVLMDAKDMNYTHEFDAAIIQISLHEMNVNDRLVVFGKMKHAVKPGGIVIITDFAASDQTSFMARITGYTIRKGEEFFLGHHPEHHANYIEFLAGGGIKGFLGRAECISSEKFMHGYLEMCVVRTG